MPDTVHILEAGRPVCGFHPTGPPSSWPEGHRWVRADGFRDASCQNCLNVLSHGGVGGPGIKKVESFKRISRYTILTNDDDP